MTKGWKLKYADPFLPRDRDGRLYCRTIIFGTSGTGKTTFMAQLCAFGKYKFPKMRVILTSPTAKTDQEWINQAAAYKKHTGKKLVDNWFSTPSELAFKVMEQHIYKEGRKDPLCIIIDDCGNDTNLKYGKKNNPLNDMGSLGAHYQLFLFTLYQTTDQANIQLLRNSSLFFCKAIIDNKDRENLLEKVFGFLNKLEATKVLNLGWIDKYDLIAVDKRWDPLNPQISKNCKELIETDNTNKGL